MSQSGTMNSFEGVTAAKIFAAGSDTVTATASSVTAGTNDPTLYTIVFSGVTAGEYRMVLYDVGGAVVDSGVVVEFTASAWSVVVCDSDSGGSGGGGSDPDPSTSVETAITNPKQATADGVSVTSHSLPELIAAEKYLAAKAAASKPARGLRFSKLVPGGTVGE